ncbi:MAG: LTA synthase family protein [Deltaproteobacteria bacterium]|jgi:phosphoglycerol transferase MdoB-like AlkP superfamily enzyme|nr:LTA synthase family protein [Deltaproteobacteria bacterium]
MTNSAFFLYLSRWRPLPAVFCITAIHTALFFAARLGSLFFLQPNIADKDSIPRALYIGLKFDARWAVLLTLPLCLCLLYPPLERRLRHRSDQGASPLRCVVCAIQTLIFGFALLAYTFDFGMLFYLRQRLDLSILNFLEDPLISAVMLWQTYPVIRLCLILAAGVALYAFLLTRWLSRDLPALPPLSLPRRVLLTVLGLAGLFLTTYGQLSSNLFPLRWSNAYFSTDNNISLLALHPLQNIYDTRNSGKAPLPDEKAALEAWPRMAAWLNIPEGDAPLDYMRSYSATPLPPGRTERPNIMIIIMESLGWPRTSFSPGRANSDADPTPFLRELAKESLYFSNFYAPTRTTARAVFTTITGIPDVNHSGGTTSRNPLLVDQFSMLQEFDGYEKYYLIGGSASWANIRGLLLHNIGDLRLLEEGTWEAPNVDVWGISDLALLRESVGILGQSVKPFLAVVQTASFHRPWTIPDDNEGYVLPPRPGPEAIRHYGFDAEEEYFSLNFADHALRRFFDRVKKEPWYDNTIFVIFGDHGLDRPSENVSPGYLACSLQSWHVPLLLHAPGRVAPGINPYPHTQADVLPTLAALSGVEHRSRSLGRNMLDPANDKDGVVFISSGDDIRMLVKDGYCFSHRPGAADALYRLEDTVLINLAEQEPERAAAMRRQAADFQTTSRWLLWHNQKP